MANSVVIEFMTESGRVVVPCKSPSLAREEAQDRSAQGELPGYGKIISFFVDDRKSDRQIR